MTVRYALTERGHSLAPVLGAVRAWAYEQMDDIEASRYNYDTR